VDILWVDDDSPKKPESIEGVNVVSAQSLKEANDLLESGKVRPSWIVVDLIVPQRGWGKSLFSVPGVDFLKYLKKLRDDDKLKDAYGKDVGLVAYGVALTDKKREDAKSAGARSVYEKMSTSWIDVITDLKQLGAGIPGD
jgi:hypothetical protein